MLPAVIFLVLLLFLPVAYFFGEMTSDVAADRQRLIGDLEEKRATWSTNKPDQFQYLIRRRCFCGEEIVRPFKVIVRNGAVRVLAIDDAPVKMLPAIASVEDLFDVLEKAIREADRVSVAYSDEYAFPVQIRIDWSSEVIDEEDSYQISSFEVIKTHAE